MVEESTTIIGLRALIVDHLIKSWITGKRVFNFKISLLHSKITIKLVRYICIFYFLFVDLFLCFDLMSTLKTKHIESIFFYLNYLERC